ncbi:sigma-70 family RNA polymerase sigma factor [Solirubrobacter sp. CPCC 204708]|uniref:Sigma-70 family RNA polymerase sigma factor n=1 Tax=Solirubrobacter deserti TaxID=2282478 RepID=A0ABT4RV65_9ACTN|nr:sigma-70 family RNA polymerase sigma factor [Solirubrobacter deserti]MBE2318934.1 sigma-70 family RNA polymerase sigma factor [Solirubrobacter deserti]MDA0142479.1 sigma-70 family RNA polymerase sigma factor [Solirubrobacter deserti]
MSADSLERAFRGERGAVLATITRRLDGDLALAEDVVQDAFVAAAVEWDRRGVPDRPGAWLTTTAWRKALDRLRHQRVVDAHAAAAGETVTWDEIDWEQSSLEDDQLRMLFACCHPALSPEARMALTLRSVAGLTVPEIARAFISTEPAMERRLTRARNKVSQGRIPFRVPSDDLLPERLAGVLRVVYLIFNEGHAATRGDLRAEGVRLARLLARLMPDTAEALGLLALLLLTDARTPARLRGDELVALAEQDRALWDGALIAEGVAVLERALRLPHPGAYTIQAAIAALHDQAPSFAATDWSQIAGLYGELARIDASPVVTINRAVAVGFADGPAAGLELLDAVEGLERYVSLHAARAELLGRLGDAAGADAAYARAIALSAHEHERAALIRRRTGRSPTR